MTTFETTVTLNIDFSCKGKFYLKLAIFNKESFGYTKIHCPFNPQRQQQIWNINCNNIYSKTKKKFQYFRLLYKKTNLVSSSKQPHVPPDYNF